MEATLIVVGAVVALILFYSLKPNALMKQTDKAMDSGDIEPLVQTIEKQRSENQATCFNKAVKTMWNSYERPLAISFIRKMAPKLADSHIAQYWIRQVLEVEPDLAKETFDDDFLRQVYNPEVAATCGKAG